MISVVKNVCQKRILDFIVSIFIVAGISVNLFEGFVIPESLTSNIGSVFLLAGFCLLVYNILFYNVKISVISVSILIFVIMGFAVYSRSTDFFAGGFPFQEYQMFYVIIFSSSLYVFITVKTKAGTVLLYLTGIVIMFILSILQYTRHSFWFVVFLLFTSIIYLSRGYLFKTDVNYRKFSSNVVYTGYLFLLGTAGILISAILCLGIINILKPPAKQLSFLNNNAVLAMAENIGAATPIDDDTAKQHYEKQETISNDQDAEQVASGDTNLMGSDDDSGQNGNQSDENQDLSGQNSQDSQNQEAAPITYNRIIPLWIKIVVAVFSTFLLIVMVFLIKRLLLRRRHKKASGLDYDSQIIWLYSFYLKILARLGYKRRKSDTPYEYAESLRNSVHSIDFGNYTFKDVTDVFVSVKYGRKNNNPDKFHFISDFDQMFLKCCRKDMGTFRYLLKYLML